MRRPRDPVEPYPHLAEEVTYPNPDGGHTMAGTFTRPAEGGPFPSVILISGSGPRNRDEELMGHRPFLVLADHLTRRGIAGHSEGGLIAPIAAVESDDVSFIVLMARPQPPLPACGNGPPERVPGHRRDLVGRGHGVDRGLGLEDGGLVGRGACVNCSRHLVNHSLLRQ